MKNAEYKRVVSVFFVCFFFFWGGEFKRKRKHDIAVFIAREMEGGNGSKVLENPQGKT